MSESKEDELAENEQRLRSYESNMHASEAAAREARKTLRSGILLSAIVVTFGFGLFHAMEWNFHNSYPAALVVAMVAWVPCAVAYGKHTRAQSSLRDAREAFDRRVHIRHELSGDWDVYEQTPSARRRRAAARGESGLRKWERAWDVVAVVGSLAVIVNCAYIVAIFLLGAIGIDIHYFPQGWIAWAFGIEAVCVWVAIDLLRQSDSTERQRMAAVAAIVVLAPLIFVTYRYDVQQRHDAEERGHHQTVK
jgi:uncharacterized membrane protein YdfJ with MMPL/SSD domain